MMNEWYKAPHVDVRIWLLDHIAELGLSSDEALIALQILHHNQINRHIVLEALAAQCAMKPEKADKVLASLSKKGYLSIDVGSSGVSYNLEALFVKKSPPLVSGDLLAVFEREFKRPLSSHEIDKITDWRSRLSDDHVILALREALIYNKLNFAYIDRILSTWLNDGTTLQQLHEGQRNHD
jgi:DNA replication protein